MKCKNLPKKDCFHDKSIKQQEKVFKKRRKYKKNKRKKQKTGITHKILAKSTERI